jgi:hypothetical protein
MSIAVSPIDGAVYALVSSGTSGPSGAHLQLRRSTAGTSGTFSTVYGKGYFSSRRRLVYFSYRWRSVRCCFFLGL